jgi:hypothetical protein
VLIEDFLGAAWFEYCYGLLVLKLVTYVVAIDRTGVVDDLFPCGSHLVCGTFLSVVEDMDSKRATHTLWLRHSCSRVTRSSSSSSAASGTATVRIASVAVASSSSRSSAHDECHGVGEGDRSRY